MRYLFLLMGLLVYFSVADAEECKEFKIYTKSRRAKIYLDGEFLSTRTFKGSAPIGKHIIRIECGDSTLCDTVELTSNAKKRRYDFSPGKPVLSSDFNFITHKEWENIGVSLNIEWLHKNRLLLGFGTSLYSDSFYLLYPSAFYFQSGMLIQKRDSPYRAVVGFKLGYFISGRDDTYSNPDEILGFIPTERNVYYGGLALRGTKNKGVYDVYYAIDFLLGSNLRWAMDEFALKQSLRFSVGVAFF